MQETAVQIVTHLILLVYVPYLVLRYIHRWFANRNASVRKGIRWLYPKGNREQHVALQAMTNSSPDGWVKCNVIYPCPIGKKSRTCKKNPMDCYNIGQFKWDSVLGVYIFKQFVDSPNEGSCPANSPNNECSLMIAFNAKHVNSLSISPMRSHDSVSIAFRQKKSKASFVQPSSLNEEEIP